MTAICDSHVHMDSDRFDGDRDAVLTRARAAGVDFQIIPAVNRASWLRISELCNAHDGLYPAYGWHPMFIGTQAVNDIGALEHWLDDHRAVAVGEIGLDFHRDDIDRELQRTYFEMQLELARDRNLPVIIHSRKAVEEVTLALRRIGKLRGVLHSFSGSLEQARQVFELGFFIGIGGPITYTRARRLHRLVADMPIGHLLLETDAPDQPTAQHRGERNEPARIVHVLRHIAQMRNATPEAIAEATCRNARQLFGF